MITWADFSILEPELAAFGAELLRKRPAYLATQRKNGSPRVHPVTPIISDTGLFLFMEPTSPKGIDLRERVVYAIHNGVPDNAGSGGEFFVRGDGREITDPNVRALVVAACSYPPADRYVLFELLVGEARCNGYGDVTLPEHRRWRA
ncbi:MAG: pyridoxamine 5'-phosphate oxidase [Acidimicrobiia bacterium]